MTPHLSLESLETRETPAIVFVGGWGSSMYQSSSGATDAAARWKLDWDDISIDHRHATFEQDGNTIYVGASGGVWKTKDGGQNWLEV